jgi:hypothetical protein
MSHAQSVARYLVAAGFIFIIVVAIFIEPGMGLRAPADFFDPALILRGTESVAWKIEGVLYLAMGVAFASLGTLSDDRYLRGTGLVAGVLFFIVGSLDRMMATLPGLVAAPDNVATALRGMLPVRFALLRTLIVAVGFFAWLTTRQPGGGGLWRGLGYLVLAGALAFSFAPVPTPLLIMVWAVWYAVRGSSPAAAAP